MLGDGPFRPGGAEAAYHTPVLLAEVLRALLVDDRGTYIDATLGGGGHAAALLERLRPEGRLIGLDADQEALAAASSRLSPDGTRTVLVRANFRDLGQEMARRGITAVAGILLDLGVSSHQIDDAARGFSFRGEGRLDMRMDRTQARSAWEVVNSYPEERLREILRTYGEEFAAARIARRIVRARPVETTGALASLLRSIAGPVHATKTQARVFQAIRIEVNGELASLEAVLPAARDLLRPGGRLVVIAYHSLEDRAVKEFFREESATRIPSGHRLLPDTVKVPTLRVLTRRPITPPEEEIARNSRARSAKLRAAERLPDQGTPQNPRT